MATLISLKRRIKTAKNVSKTTKAMQMIAASKLKKAEEAAVQSKPYVEKLEALSKGLYTKVDREKMPRYMRRNENVNNKLIILISPDKGLAGGLVTNLIKEVTNQDEKNKNFYITIGKKAEGYMSAFGKDIIASFPFGNSLPSFEFVYPLSKIIGDYYLANKISSVVLVTTKFINVFSQAPFSTTLLPIQIEEDQQKPSDVLFEPDAAELLPDLLNHYLELSLYQNLLESYASEQAARMVAMKNATDNAKDMIFDLTLEYNKSRQEKITNELLDIGGGSFANA